MPIPRQRYHAPKKEIMYVQETDRDQEWTPEEEACEEGSSGSEGEQSIHSDSGDESGDEKEIPKQTQSLRNIIVKNIRAPNPHIERQHTSFQNQSQLHHQAQINQSKYSHHPQPIEMKNTPQTSAGAVSGRKKRQYKQVDASVKTVQDVPQVESKKYDRKRVKRSAETVEYDAADNSMREVIDGSETSRPEVSGENLDLTKAEKKETLFDVSDVDYNLYTAAPQNIVEKKIMLGNNLLVLSKMMEAAGDKGQTYEYAAISFQRKLKSQKAYTFNIPLNLAPTLIRALELIMSDNKTYFAH